MTRHSTYRRSSKIQNIIHCAYHFKLLMVIAVAILGAAYIAEANTVSSHGIKIKTLQKEITDSQRDYQQIEIQVASSQSMNAIEPRIQLLQLVPMEHPAYVTIPSSVVALR